MNIEMALQNFLATFLIFAMIFAVYKMFFKILLFRIILPYLFNIKKKYKIWKQKQKR